MPQTGTKEPAPMTASEILDILERHYTGRRPGQHLLFREFPLESGVRGRSLYRIDGLLVRLSQNHPADRKAIEVKVRRDDFKRELETPEKRQRAMRIADCFYFAVPYGLIEPDEVPEDCGLLWIRSGDLPPMHMKMPKIASAPAPDWPLIRDLVWRAFAFGQEDAAKREELAAWPEIEGLAETVADLLATDGDKEEVLTDLNRALLKYGRRREAKRIRELKNELGQVLSELETIEAASA